jgi:hypothetical protein
MSGLGSEIFDKTRQSTKLYGKVIFEQAFAFLENEILA